MPLNGDIIQEKETGHFNETCVILAITHIIPVLSLGHKRIRSVQLKSFWYEVIYLIMAATR